MSPQREQPHHARTRDRRQCSACSTGRIHTICGFTLTSTRKTPPAIPGPDTAKTIPPKRHHPGTQSAYNYSCRYCSATQDMFIKAFTLSRFLTCCNVTILHTPKLKLSLCFFIVQKGKISLITKLGTSKGGLVNIIH